jgi:hypothetical protein
MNPLAMVPALIFILSATLPLGQQTVGKRPSLCQPDSLPSAIQHRLREEYGSWRVQDVANLSQRAHERWESEKPLECPGIAVGYFESAQTRSYALLLVPVGNADAGYRFLVFSQKTGESDYEVSILDRLDGSGATNHFLRGTPIGKFFDEASKKRFHARTSAVILLFDSAENEYGVDVYYWSDGHYKHDPVDY